MSAALKKKVYQNQTTWMMNQEVRRSFRHASSQNEIINRNARSRKIDRKVSSKTISTRQFRKDRKSEIFFAGGLFLILLAKLFVRVSIIETNYSIENVKKELLAEDAKLRVLTVKKAMVASPHQLSQIASNKLIMSPIVPQQIRRLKIERE